MVALFSCTGGQRTAFDVAVGAAVAPNYNDQFAAAADDPLLPSAAVAVVDVVVAAYFEATYTFVVAVVVGAVVVDGVAVDKH